MSNNITVARQLLKMAKEGNVITIATLVEATQVHSTQIRPFLQVWGAAGWLTVDKNRRPFVFQITDQGATGLTKLVDEYDPTKPDPSLAFRRKHR